MQAHLVIVELIEDWIDEISRAIDVLVAIYFA